MKRPSYFTLRIVQALVIVITVLGFGGVFKEIISLSAALSLIALLLATFARRRISVDGFGLLLLFVTLVTGLQLLPLPIGWIETLAPMTAEAIRRGATARGLPTPTFTSISLDPEATRLAVSWWLAVTATYLATRQLQSRRKEQAPIILLLPWLGVLILISGLVHTALNISAIFGLYEPVSSANLVASEANYQSVFLNPNHLAAFLNGGLVIALAWAGSTIISSRDRVFYYAAFLMLATGVILTGSKAGILSALMACALVLTASQANHNRTLMLILTTAVLSLCLILPIGEQLTALIGITDWSRTTHHQTHLLGIEVLSQWPLTGTGRGAFGSAHTIVGTDGHHYITHAHNSFLQILIDYGWPAGGSALVLGVILLGRSVGRALKAPLGLGVCAALFALGVHNLVDFSLDILGVALMAAVFASSIRASTSGYRVPRVLSVLCITLALGVTVWSYFATGLEAGPRREAMIESAPIVALDRYPTDAYAFLAAGLKTQDADLIRHAAWLHPKEPRIQLALAALGTSTERPPAIQATLSSVRGYQHRLAAFQLIRATATTAEMVLSSLPNEEATAHYLNWLSAPSRELLAAAAEKYPRSGELLRAIGQRYLRQGDVEAASDIATRLMIAESPHGYHLMGDLFLRQKKALRAYHMFIAAGDIESQMKAARVAVENRLPARALSVLNRVAASPRHLKEIQSLRSRAMALMNEKGLEPVRAIDVFEAPNEVPPTSEAADEAPN